MLAFSTQSNIQPMNSSALAMMLISDIVVTVFTVYFFVQVLRTPGTKHEGDFQPGP
jgi:hypothetical protein